MGFNGRRCSDSKSGDGKTSGKQSVTQRDPPGKPLRVLTYPPGSQPCGAPRHCARPGLGCPRRLCSARLKSGRTAGHAQAITPTRRRSHTGRRRARAGNRVAQAPLPETSRERPRPRPARPAGCGIRRRAQRMFRGSEQT